MAHLQAFQKFANKTATSACSCQALKISSKLQLGAVRRLLFSVFEGLGC